jgi:hypothetical protein
MRKAGRRTATGNADLAIEFAHYPLVPPGTYSAYCAWTHQYFDRGFRRWTCLLLFDLFHANGVDVIARVPMWLSLGPGQKARASRRGKYLAEWVKARGGPPARGDRLSPRVFAHRMALVEVRGTMKGPAPYSVVRTVLQWLTGNGVSQSTSQLIKVGSQKVKPGE